MYNVIAIDGFHKVVNPYASGLTFKRACEIHGRLDGTSETTQYLVTHDDNLEAVYKNAVKQGFQVPADALFYNIRIEDGYLVCQKSPDKCKIFTPLGNTDAIAVAIAAHAGEDVEISLEAREYLTGLGYQIVD